MNTKLTKVIAIVCTMVLCMSLFAGCSPKEPTAAPEPSEPVAINIAALKGPTGMGLVKLMADSDAGETGNNNYTFSISGAIDEITPKLIQGTVDIAAVPANLAAVLYNNTKGQVKVLAINTLGVLYIVEKGETVKSVEDLRGKTIYASGKGASPEYVLNYILSSNGIDPDTDVTIEYKSEHAECLSALEANEGAIAMLPQPFVTAAQLKDSSIRTALDLNQEWDKIQKATGGTSSLVTGVIVARTAFIEEHADAVNYFLDQYKASVEYVNANVEDAAALIEQYDIFTAAVAQKALPYCYITFIEGAEMQDKLGGYLSVLYDSNPKSVGGALPDEAFYYNR